MKFHFKIMRPIFFISFIDFGAEKAAAKTKATINSISVKQQNKLQMQYKFSRQKAGLASVFTHISGV